MTIGERLDAALDAIRGRWNPHHWYWSSRLWGLRPWLLPPAGWGYVRAAHAFHLHRWKRPTAVITDDRGQWANVRWLMEARECPVCRVLETRYVRRLW